MIREAIPQDFHRIMELYAQLHPNDATVEDGSDRRAFDDIIANPNLLLFVLEDDSGIINATCYFNFIPNITRQAAPYAVIENVVTEVSQRNTGLGKRLLQHVLQFAWDKGCYKVMLMTGSRRESTHQFYQSCGFRMDDKLAFIARPPQ
ncbi:MAG: GNAT family N-acetyltransferase [Gammaproteobacteria bacterium]|nr:GNAT family N-acetyltransferase [Gammaproteobacteria bacterium]